MHFCLDTSVYITAANNYYAFDIVPGFWDVLLELAAGGEISSCSPVYQELVPPVHTDDDLINWVKANKEVLFTDMDDEIVDAASRIANFAVTRYQAHHHEIFLTGADPWVIAHALAKGLTVVHTEARKRVEEVDTITGLFKGDIKIPNFCDHFHVRSIDIYTFLRETNRKFHYR